MFKKYIYLIVVVEIGYALKYFDEFYNILFSSIA